MGNHTGEYREEEGDGDAQYGKFYSHERDIPDQNPLHS